MGATFVFPSVSNSQVLVAKTPFSGSVATQAITVPTNSFDKLILYALLRGSNAAISGALVVRLNNLSTAIYSQVNWGLTRSGDSPGGNFNLTGMTISDMMANNGAANAFTMLQVEVWGNKTALRKNCKIESSGQDNTASLNSVQVSYLQANILTEITEFNLISSAGNFSASGFYTVVGENKV